MCVCVCVCACMRACVRLCVSVCVYVCVSVSVSASVCTCVRTRLYIMYNKACRFRAPREKSPSTWLRFRGSDSVISLTSIGPHEVNGTGFCYLTPFILLQIDKETEFNNIVRKLSHEHNNGDLNRMFGVFLFCFFIFLTL